MGKNGSGKSCGNSGGALGFEANLWAAADKMRGHMDASEYKHVWPISFWPIRRST